MISDKQIRLGFRKKLFELGLVTVEANEWINVALENKNYSPKQNKNGTMAAWFRETLLPSSQRQVSNGYSRRQGLIQLDYFVPAGSGAYDAEDMASTVKDGFLNVTLEGGAYIYRTQHRPADQQPNWYMIPIELYYTITRKTT